MKNKELPEFDLNTTPKIYYNKKAESYNSTHMQKVQPEILSYIFERLLKQNNFEQCVALDIGIGTNIYQEVYRSNKIHYVGLDISINMLKESEADDNCVSKILCSNTLPFKPGCFDLILSVSAFHYVISDLLEKGEKFLMDYFDKILQILRKKGTLIFQFYLKDKKNIETLTEILKYLKVNFLIFASNLKANLSKNQKNQNVLENRNIKEIEFNKNKKLFLVLWVDNRKMEDVIDFKNNEIEIIAGLKNSKNRDSKKRETVKEKILRIKDKRRKKNIEVPKNSKYSGRRR